MHYSDREGENGMNDLYWFLAFAMVWVSEQQERRDRLRKQAALRRSIRKCERSLNFARKNALYCMAADTQDTYYRLLEEYQAVEKKIA